MENRGDNNDHWNKSILNKKQIKNKIKNKIKR